MLAALALASCKTYRAQQSHDVAGLDDPHATYALTLDTLRLQNYAITEEDDSARRVQVQSHLEQNEPAHRSLITLQVEGRAVHISGSGYLVHRDGTIHHTFNNELMQLQKQLQKRLASLDAVPSSPSPPAPPGPPPPPNPPASTPGQLPVAWSEPAYDPTVWGHGNFTCLPVKLSAEDQPQLTLKLSNGENADVLLSLAYAPELCRSPGECKLAGGCPALGIGDSDRVSRIAGRLSRHEVGPLATLFSHGRAVATLDLAKHGSIAQAMTDRKH